jgi:hypothetical protein
MNRKFLDERSFQEDVQRRYRVKLCIDAATSVEHDHDQRLQAAQRAFELSEGRPLLREFVESQLKHFKAAAQ